MKLIKSANCSIIIVQIIGDSMDKEITVEFKWTIEELRTAYGYDNGTNVRPVFIYCWLAIAVVFLLFSFYELFDKSQYAGSGYSDCAEAFMFTVLKTF